MRIEWTEPATDNLFAIAEYIAADSISAALRVHDTVRDQVARLHDFPHMGRPGRVRATRELVVVGTPYVVVYCVRGQAVIVLRVLHGAQRWPDRR